MSDFINGHMLTCQTCGTKSWSDDGLLCDCAAEEKREGCEHKDVQPIYKWKDKIHFNEAGDLSVRVECVDCGADGFQAFKPGDIEWEE
jgi:hypothetical protein